VKENDAVHMRSLAGFWSMTFYVKEGNPCQGISLSLDKHKPYGAALPVSAVTGLDLT
jgi:hypothetical protein